jgi:PhnB protein
MKSCQPYLNFDGNTREAMTFYHTCIGGQLDVQSFSDLKIPTPPGAENRVMHARITNGSAVLMASDTPPGKTQKVGDNVWVNLDCSSVDEIERVFAAFSEGGTVVMPLGDQFWGARFGMISDKFDVNWMFNCDLPKKA